MHRRPNATVFMKRATKCARGTAFDNRYRRLTNKRGNSYDSASAIDPSTSITARTAGDVARYCRRLRRTDPSVATASHAGAGVVRPITGGREGVIHGHCVLFWYKNSIGHESHRGHRCCRPLARANRFRHPREWSGRALQRRLHGDGHRLENSWTAPRPVRP
jgi:hypothetical protein